MEPSIWSEIGGYLALALVFAIGVPITDRLFPFDEDDEQQLDD